MTALCAAIRLATTVHQMQTDKGDQPYILHPLRVMLKCTDTDAQIVAVLGDAVEDSNGNVTLDLIYDLFGQSIRDGVDAMTRRYDEDYQMFITRCGKNRIARVVKQFDILDNMDMSRLKTVTIADQQRQNKYAGALEYLRTLP